MEWLIGLAGVAGGGVTAWIAVHTRLTRTETTIERREEARKEQRLLEQTAMEQRFSYVEQKLDYLDKRTHRMRRYIAKLELALARRRERDRKQNNQGP